MTYYHPPSKEEEPSAVRLLVALARWVQGVQEERRQREQVGADSCALEGAPGGMDHRQGSAGRIGDHGLGQQVPEVREAGTTGG